MATPTYTALATTTLSTSASSVTFSSIDGSYGDLILIVHCKPTGSGSKDLVIQFNSDSGNAERVLMSGNGSIADYATGSNLIAQFNNESDFETGISHIMDYSATDKHKTVLTRTNDGALVSAQAQRWASTSAITSINLAYSVDIASGSTFSLYGVAK